MYTRQCNVEIMRDVASNLKAHRAARCISAIELARVAGVSRQTIHAMESGSFVPNTAVALKMAKALGVTVEDLFALSPPREQMIPAPPAIGRYLPVAEAPLKSRHDRIVLAGCDPALSVLSSRVPISLSHRNSKQALTLVRSGEIQIAGSHLPDIAARIQQVFGDEPVAVVTFATWEEGILTAPGNPKTIRTVADLARRNVTLVNRERGSGSRALLDAELKQVGLKPAKVRGYTHCAPGHLAAAWQVYSRAADACIACSAAARAFGLSFVPLAAERYDLVMRKNTFVQEPVQRILEVIDSKAVRDELKNIAGCDTRQTGRRVL